MNEIYFCEVAGTQLHFFIDLAFFEKRYFKEMLWVAAAT